MKLDVRHRLGCFLVVEIRDGELISGVGSTEPPKSGGAGFAGAGAGSGGEREVTLLVDIEQIGAVEVRSDPYCDAGPPLHAHARHAEAFFVMGGELTFRLENGERRVGPGTWVFVPPEVVHTFAVTGSERARFLDLHVPSCGFGDLVRGLHAARSEEELKAVRAAFDQHPAPEYATGDPNLVVVRRGGGVEGETMAGRTDDRRATLLVDTDELTVTEFFYGPAQRGAQPHVHHHHADAFLVVEGEISMTIGDGSLRAPAETLVVLPPDVVHGFDNDGEQNMVAYNFHMPASGFADYLRGRNPDFDQHDPPAGGGADPASAIAVRLSG
jgi:mannose-6-phosphate isomerase-like protein (cupin superfamily)